MGQATSSTLHALVIDDDPGGAHVLCHCLKMLGCRVEALPLSRPAEVVNVFSQTRPDVAFVHLGHSPDAGFELAQQLRARGVQACLVCVSAWPRPGEAAWSHEAGFDHHWTKPIDVESVERLVTALGQSGNSPQAQSRVPGARVAT